MTTAPEHGAKAVRDRVANLLRADLPTRIDLLTTLWAIDTPTFPKPDMVSSGEPAGNLLDHRGKTWIEVVTPRLMPGIRNVGLTAGTGNVVARCKYQARIYGWVIDDQWATALDKRDRLTTAMRDSLLDHPTLLVPPATGDSGYIVNWDRLSEEFGVPYRMKDSPRVWCGGLLTYEIEEEYEVAPSTQPPAYSGVDWAVTLLSWKQANTPIGAS